MLRLVVGYTVGIYLSVLLTVVSGYCYNTDTNPYRFYTTETRYDTVLDTKASTHLNTSHIEGCEPSVFYLLARHGSRYANPDTIATMAETLPKFQDIITSSDVLLCDEDFDAIEGWMMRMQESDGLQLSDSGWQELRDMAQRFSLSFPELLGIPYDSSWFEFLHTETVRTGDSARAFAEGLFGSYDDVDIQELEKDGDWLLYFYENCDKYIDTVPDKMQMYEAFRNGPEMAEVFQRIQNRTGIVVDNAETLDLLHDSCSFEYQVYDDSPWCASFIQEDLEVYEYAEDIQYHWTDGYGDALNYEQTCELFKDIVYYLRLDDRASTPTRHRVLTRFAHSGALFMLFARLGLFNDGYNLTDSGYETSKDRKWRASLINPMAGNIAFVRYNCSNGEEDKVAVYVNEELVTLPISQCTDGICPVSALIDEWVPITSTCNINDICDLPISAGKQFNVSLFVFFVSLILAWF